MLDTAACVSQNDPGSRGTSSWQGLLVTKTKVPGVKLSPSTISFTTYITWISLGLNPGQHCKKPVSNNSGVTFTVKQECGNIFLNELEHTHVWDKLYLLDTLTSCHLSQTILCLLLKNRCFSMNYRMIYYSLLCRSRNTSICTRKLKSFFRVIC